MTERRSKHEAAVEEPVAAADETNEDAMTTESREAEQPAGETTVAEAASDDAAQGEAAEAEAAPVEAAPAESAAEAAATDAAPEESAPGRTAPDEPDVAPEPVAAQAEAAASETEPEPKAEEVAEAGERIAAAVAEPVGEPAEERRPRGRDAQAATSEAPARPSGPRGLRLRYHSDVIPALVKQFEYANPNQVPRLEKIVVNVGLGEALTNAKAIDAASSDITMITGQKPIVMKARRSIAQFKIRTGNPIGLKVTLRGQRMWDFLERLTLLALPRIRDFRGTPSRSFDGRGNYTLGLREQIAFPEIDYDKVDRLRGLEVSIVTTAKSDEESKRLLELLGMPFAG
jgi:large subunit ribosomal protein L5